MSSLSEHERLNLQKMIRESECEDNTDHIKKVKHSILLRDDIRKLDTFQKANRALEIKNLDQYQEEAKASCPFLYNNYTDIFNRMIKDELDLEIMTQLLMVLKMIEDGKVDQHTGSVMVGKVLKELYIDSALKRGDNLDKEHNITESHDADHATDSTERNISWKEYKKFHQK